MTRFRRFLFLFVMMAVLIPAVVFAGPEDFTELPPLPEVLFHFAAAADAKTGNVLVFGGESPGSGAVSVTYLYDRKKQEWRRIDSDETPPARSRHALCYLPSIKRFVLFGGRDSLGNFLDDTWVFKGKSWKKLSPGAHPDARGSHAMATSGDGQNVVLFGGFSAAKGDLGDTWLFDGKKWVKAITPASPAARSLSRMATFKDKGVMLYGGYGPIYPGAQQLGDLADTWLFDGVVWKQQNVEPNPGPRSDPRLVADPQSGKVYLLGGSEAGQDKTDMWVFDGATWAPVAARTPVCPANDLEMVRGSGDIAYVTIPLSEQQKVASSKFNAYLEDTWSLQGQKWVQIETPAEPKRRSFSAMAFDRKRGSMVLFGGTSADSVAMEDTWELIDSQWQMVPLVKNPGARFDHRMAYLTGIGKVVLFGGFGPTDQGDRNFADTWAYDGMRWTELVLPQSPPPRSRHMMAADPKRSEIVLFGGYHAPGGEYADTWVFNGKAWKQVETKKAPPARSSAAFSFNQNDGKYYLFGGYSKTRGILDDTWAYDPSARKWEPVLTHDIPPGRQDAGFLYDEKTGALTLFGGFDGQKDLADLWVLVGGNWKKLESAGPVARAYFIFAYDAKKGRAVLFGGYGIAALKLKAAADFSPNTKPETWEFDGKRWKKILTPHSPTPDLSYAMAYDEKRKLVVLFGGYNEQKGEMNETWVYDGEDWTWTQTKTRPSKRTNASMVYDPKRKKILLFGGYHPETGAKNDLWEFNGKDWKQLPIKCPYSNYTGGSNFVYDSARGVFVLYGGKQAE